MQMTKISFSVPGIPVGKARARTRPGGGRPFTPKKTVDYEKAVLACFQAIAPGCHPHAGPVIIRFTAIFPITEGWPPAVKEAAARGRLYHLSVPDKENIEKALLDALSPPNSKDGYPVDPTGYPWLNDKQCMGGGIKRYGSPPRLDVTLEFIDQPDGIITPGQARSENKAMERRQMIADGTLAPKKNPHNAGKPKAVTALDRAIAAADARAAKARKS